MVFVTDMVKDESDMISICEVSYVEDGKEWADSIFEEWNEPPHFGGDNYLDSQVVKIAGEENLGYYLSKANLNQEYVSHLFTDSWGDAEFDPALLRMTWRKVPSYAVTLMGWEILTRFCATETVKRCRLLDYSQMALAIEATNWPDVTYYTDLLDELAADGELPDLEEVEGPEAWEAYLNTLDKWVDSHLKVKAY